MEVKNVPLKDIKIDPLAEELSNSEDARPYLDYFTRSISGDAAGVEAALQVLRDLPLEKRYTWRVFSALKWAFADFESASVRLDLLSIPEPTRTLMTKELELRFQQLQILLQAFNTDKTEIEMRHERPPDEH
jgi:hypothetical protein